jgi:hypothetical protein
MRSRSVLAVAPFALLATISAGCLERPIKNQDPRSSAVVVEPLKLSGVERIDLLFAIDNSSSMGDKQDILARAVPDLVKRLANPRCVDSNGAAVKDQPASPTAPCPAGSEREFLAVPDIHVGIVTSSLGGFSGGACGKATENDHGHLISRKLDGTNEKTYGQHGFLAWDPDKKLDPPGESVLDDGTSGLVPSLQEMVRGAGEKGCGLESQMESWYRFLIDPDPYDHLDHQGDDLVPTGTDHFLLDQRKQFLRPDSLVAIVMLTDENDCSIAPGKDAAKMFSGTHMARPRSECDKNPDDPCCAPCDETPSGCAEDPLCKDQDGAIARLAPEKDSIDLRCYDQKRRFGKNYLYPLERYSKGLTETQILDSHGKTVPNPLFQDLDPNDSLHGTRNAGLVFLTGIVGVPWQDIARDPSSLAKGLKSAKELLARNVKGESTWDTILGDPDKHVNPLDDHMIESTKPRDGLPGPDSGPGADPISGHEQPESSSNLQYACTFPLLSPIPCSGQTGCECNKPDGNPLCQDASGNYSKTQLRAKAYPAVRELQVLKDVGEQAIVASVCPANMDEATEKDALDFGYRPAIGALVDRLKGKLGYQCLPRQLTPKADGTVSCLVIEARKSQSCSCAAADGRAPVTDEHRPAVDGARESGLVDGDDDCFCEVPQLGGKELSACQVDKSDPLVVDGQQANGWCYVDATSTPPVGSPALVPDSCPSTERRLVRLVGNAKAKPGSTLVITCDEG